MRNKYVINMRELLYGLILFPLVRIESLTVFSVIDVAYDILKILSFILTLFLCFGRFRLIGLKNDKFLVTSFLYVVLAFISALINKTSFVSVIARYLPVITIALLLSHICVIKDSLNFFRAASRFFSILLWINFIGLIVKPNGLYIAKSNRIGMLYDTGSEVYFLGKANALTPIIISMLVVIITRDIYENNTITRYGLRHVIISVLSVLIMGSGTGIIGMLVFGLLYMLYLIKKTHSKKSINFKLILIVCMLLTIGVVIFNVQYYFGLLISGVLHKDVTLSNRTNVWMIMLNYIRNNFSVLNYLIGTGLINYRQVVFGGRYAHGHNQFFDQFIQMGLFGVILYIRMLSLSLNKIVDRYNKDNNTYLILIAASIISFVIMFVAEAYTTPLIFLILAIGYRSEDLKLGFQRDEDNSYENS